MDSSLIEVCMGSPPLRSKLIFPTILHGDKGVKALLVQNADKEIIVLF